MINIKKTMSDFRLPRYKSKMVSMNRPCKIFLTTIYIDSDKKLNLRLHEARFNFSMVCSVLRNQSRVLIFLWRSLGQSCELEQHPLGISLILLYFFNNLSTISVCVTFSVLLLLVAECIGQFFIRKNNQISIFSF